MPDDAKTPCQRARDDYEQACKFWRPYHDGMSEDQKFLDGDRYVDDHGAYVKDKRLVQVKGQEIQDTSLHITAKTTEKQITIEARPNDEVLDPEEAEICVSVLNQEILNPWKGYQDIEEMAIVDARERMLGVVWMDWKPNFGPFGGEIFFRWLDPRRVMWDPCYPDPHHPLCSWLLEEKRVNVEEAKAAYPKATWLQADKSAWQDGQLKQGIPLIAGAQMGQMPSSSEYFDDDKVTLWFWWYKNDYTPGAKRAKNDGVTPLEPDARYMRCLSCGDRSPTQGELKAEDKVEESLPLMLEGGCPDCVAQGESGDMERVDAVQEDEQVRAFTKGRRLLIMAPLCAGPDDEPIYDKGWPIPSARSFPAEFITATIKGGKPMGPSDTARMWSAQQGKDQLETLGIQRVFEHRNYWILPSVGINNASGKRFMFRDDDFNVMYRDGSQAFQGEVEMKSGSGLDPMWPIIMQSIDHTLTQYRGVTDMGLTQGSSKDIAASTVAQLTTLAETQTAHFKRRVSRARGKFFGVVWDYIRATYTPQRLARLRMEGVDVIHGLHGDSLPNMDFVISESPEFTGVEKEKSDAIDSLLQIALDPMVAPFLDLIAEMKGFPPSVVRKLEKRMKEVQQQQAQQQEQGIVSAIDSGQFDGEGGDAALQQHMNGGGTGAGMAPEPAAQGA